MRQIKIPTVLVEVPPSVVNLKGYVVAGQVFWHSGGKWNVSRCLMCFKENTALEMMLCDRDHHNGPDVDEVYISPNHVVRGIHNGISTKSLRQQLAADQMSLTLVDTTKPLLDRFIDVQSSKQVQDRVGNLEKELRAQKAQNEALVRRISQLEDLIRKAPDSESEENRSRKRARRVLQIASS